MHPSPPPQIDFNATQSDAGKRNGLEAAAEPKNQTQPNRPTGGLSSRDSLLASIRSAAGRPSKRDTKNKRPLRALESQRPIDESSSGAIVSDSKFEPARDSNVDGGGDLMSDLVSKLRARRDGISGKNPPVSAAEPLDTIQHRVMSQISTLIPETSPIASYPRKGPVELESDEDEEDDDDWRT